MKKRWLTMILAAAMTAGMAAGAGAENVYDDGGILDPAHPVSLTIWHYYNGAHQAAFEALVDEFNRTVGKELGIYVSESSKGSVSDLENAVWDAVNKAVGAEKIPDLFSTYTDSAYELQQIGTLTDLNGYFTQEELEQYVDAYVEEGKFAQDGGLYVFPVAKSTECTMLNRTDWEAFAAETEVSLEDLDTLEGIVRTAEQYYNWTDSQTPEIPDDGKAFYGRDSMSNYFLIGMKQQGQDLFSKTENGILLNADRDALYRLWENYYVPYVKGYFVSYGKFGSDDVKTGDTLAYTGSTSSSMYFPDSVELEDDSYPIEYLVLDAPHLEGEEAYQVQQGAGMAVTKSDAIHEYAGSIFLKWFTQAENNLKFGCTSGYLPVKKEANQVEMLDQVIQKDAISIPPKTYDCISSVMEAFENIQFYVPVCFEHSYPVRKILDYHLKDKAAEDRAKICESMAQGMSGEEAAAPYLTEEAFSGWYEEFVDALTEAAGWKE